MARVTRYVLLAVAVSTATAALWGQSEAQRAAPLPSSAAEVKRQIPYADAGPILELLRPNLPSELATRTPAQLEAAWPDWVSRRDADIRRRLEQGDEDSLFNLLLFGTSFTRLPRALNDSARIGGRQRGAEIVRGRIADMVAGIASPGANDRLLFARELIARQGIDPATPAGKEQVRLYLLGIMKRVVGEIEDYARTIKSARSVTDATVEVAARSTLFHARGLSSDTSIRADFAIDQALETITSRGLLGRGSVRRAAVIGPGLDFTDKAEGYDFYPQQTIQPFSVIDSLRRLGLAHSEGLRLTTFDLSPRINQHLAAAVRRASGGSGYVIVLPHDRDVSWRAGLLKFWKGFGSTIGEDTTAAPSPPAGVSVDVRAVAVRPDIVMSIEPRDVNVVLERLAPSAVDQSFDLVVATNMFVYYDALEQSLALANVASMLRPGGLLLSNDVLLELPATPIHSAGYSIVTYTDRSDDNDHIVWYQRR